MQEKGGGRGRGGRVKRDEGGLYKLVSPKKGGLLERAGGGGGGGLLFRVLLFGSIG